MKMPDVKEEEEARKWRLSERYGWLVRLLDFVKGNGDHPPSLWRVEEMLTDYLKTPLEKKEAVAESVVEKCAADNLEFLRSNNFQNFREDHNR